MLRVSTTQPLGRDGGDVEIEFKPECAGVALLSITCGFDVEVSAVRAQVDEAPLAVNFQRQSDHVLIDLGWLDVQARVNVCLFAQPPVRSGSSWLRVSAGFESEEVALELEASPAFHFARSRLRFSSHTATPGETLTLYAETTNDGNAVAHAPLIHLRIPPSVTIDGGEHAWMEVESDGSRVLVIPIETVAVAERFVHSVSVRLAPIGINRTLLRFDGWLAVGATRFRFQPAEIEVASMARCAASVHLVEPRTYHFGERVLAVVGLNSTGSDVVRRARVRLAAEGIAWAGLQDGIIDFGSVPPFAEAARLVEGEVIATPSGEQGIMIRAFALAESGELNDACAPLSIYGAPRIEATLTVEPCDNEMAHCVQLHLTNRGDGLAGSVTVMAHLPDGVVGVVDSLLIDGVARYALDGSVPVLCGDEVGPIAVGAERIIVWRVRSEVDREDATVSVSLEVDARRQQVIAQANFVTGNRASQSTLAKAIALCASDCSADLEDDDLAQVPLPPIGESALEIADAPATRIRYGIADDAANIVRAWYPQGASNTELGRAVLAARAFVPVGSCVAAADAALSGVRAEAGTVSEARLQAFQDTGIFGASGFDFSTAMLRKSIRSYYSALDEEAGDLDGVGLDRAIVRTIGAVGTPFAQPVEEFRNALVDTLGEVRGTVDYGNPAPRRLVIAVGELLAALEPAGVV